MAEVLGQVTRWASDDFPGWVEVQVRDADNRTLTIVDEVPIFTAEPLAAATPLPVEVWLSCDAEPEVAGRIRVSLHWVETEDGNHQFEAPADQVR